MSAPLRKTCAVPKCGRKPFGVDFCREHFDGWWDSRERAVLLRIVDALGAVAEPAWGPVLTAAEDVAVSAFAKRAQKEAKS